MLKGYMAFQLVNQIVQKVDPSSPIHDDLILLRRIVSENHAEEFRSYDESMRDRKLSPTPVCYQVNEEISFCVQRTQTPGNGMVTRLRLAKPSHATFALYNAEYKSTIDTVNKCLKFLRHSAMVNSANGIQFDFFDDGLVRVVPANSGQAFIFSLDHAEDRPGEMPSFIMSDAQNFEPQSGTLVLDITQILSDKEKQAKQANGTGTGLDANFPRTKEEAQRERQEISAADVGELPGGIGEPTDGQAG